MKQIFKIAKLELKLWFYSPIAWLVLIFFMFQAGSLFYSQISYFPDLVIDNRHFPDITMHTFKEFWIQIQKNLILYMPLLTMGVFSREISSGSIKLLLSSPVRSSEIVLGKYLAIIIYALLFISFLTLIVCTGAYAIVEQDNKLLISGLISTFCLICAYGAIGLFVSALTSYQVVAAIATMASFALLDQMQNVLQDYDFFRNITYFLALSGRTWMMLMGLITTEDIIYFIVIIVMFTGLLIIKLEADRKQPTWRQNTLKYTGFVSILLLIGYFSSRPTAIRYIDMTANKRYTLTENSKAIVKKIKDPVKIHMLVNVMDEGLFQGLPSSIITQQKIFEVYQQHLPKIEMDYTYYYDSSKFDNLYANNPGKTMGELVERQLVSYEFEPEELLSPEEMRKKVDLRHEENRFVRQLQIGDKTAITRQFADMVGFPIEQEISSAIKRMTDSVQTFVFTKGHGERNIDRIGDDGAYKRAVKDPVYRNSLINYGLDVVQVDLRKEKLLANTTTLVIADPKIPFTPEELLQIKNFIAGGGNLLLSGEPGYQHVVNPIAELIGIKYKQGAVQQPGSNFSPDFIRPEFSTYALSEFPDLKEVDASLNRYKVHMDGATAIEVDSANLYNSHTLLEVNGFIKNSDSVDRKSSAKNIENIPVAVVLNRNTGKKEQRILVMGDADYMNNLNMLWNPFIEMVKINANFEFHRSMMQWLSNDMFPVNAKHEEPHDDTVALTKSEASMIEIGLLWVLPSIVLLMGSIILIRRKMN